MPLSASAAMLLVFDIEEDIVAEHDRWHTHEHLPERLSIPGFLRGSRWTADGEGVTHYMVLYEVEAIDVLSSRAYLARLENPTPWTQEIMPHYRGMTRGLCDIRGSFGAGLGKCAGLVRFSHSGGSSSGLTDWLLGAVLAGVPTMPGLGSVYLLEASVAAEMTNEQRIRGADQSIDMALIVTGYDSGAVPDFVNELSSDPEMVKRGASGVTCETYHFCYVLSDTDLA